MPREATGGIVEKTTTRGTSYAMRFRAHGKRQYVLIGYASEGWTRRRAEEELANTLADVRRGQWIPAEMKLPDTPKEIPTFHVFASEWLEAKRLDGLRPKSIDALEWALSGHLLAVFAPKRLHEITVEDVDRYARQKVKAGKLSNRSINHTLNTLSAILETAVEYGHVERNVAKGRRRRLPLPRPQRTHLDCAEHIAALVEGAGLVDEECARRGYTNPYRRPLIATLVFSGLRIGEALDLRWADVNLADCKLKVRPSSADAPGPKTAAGVRVVNINAALRSELATYRARCTSAEFGARVFGSSTGGRISESNVRLRILAKAVEHANAMLDEQGLEPLPEGLTPHSLRRTFASTLAALGEPMPSCIRQMGHTQAGFTLSVYSQDIARGDTERERLRALVDGVEWVPLGTSDVSAPETDVSAPATRGESARAVG